MTPAAASESDVLDELLDGRVGAELPERLLQLAAVAAELAEVLTSPALTPSQRARLLLRAREMAGRRSRLLGVVPRPRHPVALSAGAAGAAVTLAVLGIALLRRAAHAPALPPAIRPAA